MSLTSNISAKTWSNWTCRGCFGNVRTSRFQICPWFWKSTKICGSNRAKQKYHRLFSTTVHVPTFAHQNYLQNMCNQISESISSCIWYADLMLSQCLTILPIVYPDCPMFSFDPWLSSSCWFASEKINWIDSNNMIRNKWEWTQQQYVSMLLTLVK